MGMETIRKEVFQGTVPAFDWINWENPETSVSKSVSLSVLEPNT
jgi:hypothetical protein